SPASPSRTSPRSREPTFSRPSRGTVPPPNSCLLARSASPSKVLTPTSLTSTKSKPASWENLLDPSAATDYDNLCPECAAASGANPHPAAQPTARIRQRRCPLVIRQPPSQRCFPTQLQAQEFSHAITAGFPQHLGGRPHR